MKHLVFTSLPPNTPCFTRINGPSELVQPRTVDGAQQQRLLRVTHLPAPHAQKRWIFQQVLETKPEKRFQISTWICLNNQLFCLFVSVQSLELCFVFRVDGTNSSSTAAQHPCPSPHGSPGSVHSDSLTARPNTPCME